MTETTSPRNFTAHVKLTAENASPAMRSGVHESVAEFIALTALYADIDSVFETFEPASGNQWLSAQYAAAVACSPDPAAPRTAYPYMLAVYVEGDVTTYRFQRFEDAARAGRLWAVGLI